MFVCLFYFIITFLPSTFLVLFFLLFLLSAFFYPHFRIRIRHPQVPGPRFTDTRLVPLYLLQKEKKTKQKKQKNAILFCFVLKGTQLSPEAVVNNGGDKRRCNERQGYLALCTDLEGVAVFAGFMP